MAQQIPPVAPTVNDTMQSKIDFLRSDRFANNRDFLGHIAKKLEFFGKNDDFYDFLIDHDLLDNFVLSLVDDGQRIKKYLEKLNLISPNNYNGIALLKSRYETTAIAINQLINDITEKLKRAPFMIQEQNGPNSDNSQFYLPFAAKYNVFKTPSDITKQTEYLIVIGDENQIEREARLIRMLYMLYTIGTKVLRSIIFVSNGKKSSEENQIQQMISFVDETIASQEDAEKIKETYDQIGKIYVNGALDFIGGAVFTNLEIKKRRFGSAARTTFPKIQEKSEKPPKFIIISGLNNRFITSYVYRYVFPESFIIVNYIPDASLGMMSKRSEYQTLIEENEAETNVISLYQDKMFTTGDYPREVEQNVEIGKDAIYIMLLNLVINNPNYQNDGSIILDRFAPIIDANINEEFKVSGNQTGQKRPPSTSSDNNDTSSSTTKRPTTGGITLPNGRPSPFPPRTPSSQQQQNSPFPQKSRVPTSRLPNTNLQTPSMSENNRRRLQQEEQEQTEDEGQSNELSLRDRLLKRQKEIQMQQKFIDALNGYGSSNTITTAPITNMGSPSTSIIKSVNSGGGCLRDNNRISDPEDANVLKAGTHVIFAEPISSNLNVSDDNNNNAKYEKSCDTKSYDINCYICDSVENLKKVQFNNRNYIVCGTACRDKLQKIK